MSLLHGLNLSNRQIGAGTRAEPSRCARDDLALRQMVYLRRQPPLLTGEASLMKSIWLLVTKGILQRFVTRAGKDAEIGTEGCSGAWDIGCRKAA
ncbi:MAG: hypothetical protein R2867_23575 [Caldilineaceae bacterium]